jgi:hydrogenase nickel incorporation protein HypA/HybF
VHEVSLLQAALEMALDAAERQRARRIRRITLRVGILSGVVPEPLDFAFDVVTRGTPAEEARLNVEEFSAVWQCDGCGQSFRPAA